MKIQCPCGAKYSFDVTPEMALRPLHFVCSNCGLDASAAVNELIRQELNSASQAPAPEASPAPTPPPAVPPVSIVADPAPTHAPAAPRIALRARATSTAHAEPATNAAQSAQAAQAPTGTCVRHPGEAILHRCAICQKPLCQKCMELFGYVCSPLCKAKATSHGINVPVYEGQRSAVEARYWGKIARIGGGVGGVLALFLGVWFWYAWFGSVPHVAFSTRFDQPSYSGSSTAVGNDLVFLHGGTLARYGWKSKKQIWSEDLVDQKELADEIDREKRSQDESIQSMRSHGASRFGHIATPEEIAAQVRRLMEASLHLRVVGSNIWVAKAEKLIRYDWNSGKPAQEIALPQSVYEAIPRGNELMFVKRTGTGQQISHFSLVTGETRTEDIQLADQPPAPAARPNPAVAGASPNSSGRGLPNGRGTDRNKPFDRDKVASDVQNLPYPNRVALPATLANNMHQERIMNELDEDEEPAETNLRVVTADHGSLFEDSPERVELIPRDNGNVRFSVKLLERHMVSRKAKKDKPKTSAMNDNPTVGNSDAMVNEMLNENTPDNIEIDMSRYQVTLHADGVDADWTGEIVGPPFVYPLKTVTVVVGRQMAVVLDKTNKKLWDATFAFDIPEGDRGEPEENGLSTGEGPCIEHDGMLYIFDQAVLAGYDLKTGNAAWRIPSVNIVGVHFDSAGMMYVNGTTATVEKIKYSRQIDVSDKTIAIIYKVEPKTGKILWTAEEGGYLSYISGNRLYTYQSNRNDTDPDDPYAPPVQIPSYVTIKRIDTKKGHAAWVHTEMRAPLDVHFSGNTIELTFRKEVELLKFLSF
jgi:hypothetical protein